MFPYHFAGITGIGGIILGSSPIDFDRLRKNFKVMGNPVLISSCHNLLENITHNPWMPMIYSIIHVIDPFFSLCSISLFMVQHVQIYIQYNILHVKSSPNISWTDFDWNDGKFAHFWRDISSDLGTPNHLKLPVLTVFCLVHLLFVFDPGVFSNRNGVRISWSAHAFKLWTVQLKGSHVSTQEMVPEISTTWHHMWIMWAWLVACGLCFW